MLPRVESKGLELLSRGEVITKYELCKAAPCHPLAAHRALRKMHAEGTVRIKKWVLVNHQPIPAYTLEKGADAPKPAPKGKR